MAQWGRGGVGLVDTGQAGSYRYGQLSLWLAVIAFTVGLLSLIFWINVPEDLPEQWRDIATVAFMAGFFGIAPILHTVGFVFALIAVFRSGERRGLGVLGLLLNSVSVLIGVGFVYIALLSLGSFT